MIEIISTVGIGFLYTLICFFLLIMICIIQSLVLSKEEMNNAADSMEEFIYGEVWR